MNGLFTETYKCSLCGKEHKETSMSYRWVRKGYKHLVQGYYMPRLSEDELFKLKDGEQVICTDRRGCERRRVKAMEVTS